MLMPETAELLSMEWEWPEISFANSSENGNPSLKLTLMLKPLMDISSESSLLDSPPDNLDKSAKLLMPSDLKWKTSEKRWYRQLQRKHKLTTWPTSSRP